jgi:hypothetical protein
MDDQEMEDRAPNMSVGARLADVFLLASLLVLISSFFVYVGRWQLPGECPDAAWWVGSERVA